MSWQVLISTSTFGEVDREPLELLERAGVSYRLNPHRRTLDRDETRELLAGAEGLIAGTEPLDREVLSGARGLRVISRCGSGLDNIDLAAAEELGIRVFSTPEAPVEGVAELALAGMLDLLRRLCWVDRQLRGGAWERPVGRLLRGKTVGVVGMGRIGWALVRLLEPFEAPILACDPRPDPEFARRRGVEYCSLENLVERSDVVSLHASANPEEGPLLDRELLARMRPGAVLVNCARGGLVDEEALAEMLRSGRLAGAHLDVFRREPYDGPLVGLPNVLLSPHIGACTAETRLRMETEAVEHLLGCLGGEERR